MVTRLSPFEPINQVTPFTYRDNATYLALLNSLRAKTSEIIEHVGVVDETMRREFTDALVKLVDDVDGDLKAIEAYWSSRISGALDNNVTSFDPTRGDKFNSISRAMSNVFDNVRVYAYFAKQYDELEMTAEEYDNLNLTARQYDLAPTSTLNATQI